jgi:hypothetical protein
VSQTCAEVSQRGRKELQDVAKSCKTSQDVASVVECRKDVAKMSQSDMMSQLAKNVATSALNEFGSSTLKRQQ